MDFLELVKQRRSCRAFTADSLTEEQLQLILTAAQLAPSACNIQPLQLHLLRGERLEAARKCAWLYNCQAAVLVCTLDDKAWVRKHDGENFALADAAIAVDHMALAAASIGVDSCIIGAIKLADLKQALNLPEGEHAQLILALGHADQSAEDKLKLHDKRRALSELVSD